MGSARIQAVKLLGRTFAKGGYSNILLDKTLENSGMEDRDKKLCSVLYYGVLERKITLDYIISGYSRQGISKMNPEILNILRTGIYQLKFMDGIPESAAVNESVKIAKSLGLGKLSGFVNAVMRNFLRDGKKINYPEDKIKRLSVEYSVPVWLCSLLSENYSESQTRSLLESSVEKPPVTIRLNNIRCPNEENISETLGMNAEKTFLNGCFLIENGDVTRLDSFKKGLFHVQDIASQLCCVALDPSVGETVLDLCSAPGGKAFTLAELMNDSGKIYAFDIHENRVKLIKNGAERLGISCITADTGNASVFNENVPKADKILCDVPCSGLGVIRRKPEIKYKSFEEFERLPEIQYKILETASEYLKPGGELVYSTCTVNPAENGQVIDKFLMEHKNFEGVSFLEHFGKPFGDYKVTLFPDNFNSDGFFISKIKRTE
ncbi:16S rRNA (cytosine(967)-C(5))-methyltransferase RsmB [Porcipelethomonas sp.]|uniref:16S rRNA (cytosine(967)-C(5))-methyltransferase RsmB n=1 Tax=Porcipelethomonas sp. TaxID=2981675 RepID=UPI003EF8C3F3